MKKLSVEDFVKTSCGIDQYNLLKKINQCLENCDYLGFYFLQQLEIYFYQKKNNLIF